jgi:hypothetical protein
VSIRRRLSLEVEPDTEPPVGSLRDERGEAIAFSGWLGLASALDRALRAAPSGAGGGERERPLTAASKKDNQAGEDR